MGRPRKPITGTSPTADIARQLRVIQDNAGYKLRELSVVTNYSNATLSEALGGQKLPSWPVTRSIVEACDGKVDDWHERWAQAAQHNIISSRPRLRATLTAQEILAVVAGPPPVPCDVDTLADFMKWIDRVRTWAGRPSVRDIAARAGVPPTTMYEFLAHKKDTLPRIEMVILFLKGCGVSSAEVFAEWTFHWKRLANDRHEDQPPPSRPRIAS